MTLDIAQSIKNTACANGDRIYCACKNPAEVNDAADNPPLNGDYTLTGGGELIAASVASQTPEPSTLLLFASGLGSLVAYRRRRENGGSSLLDSFCDLPVSRKA
jgi:hypothetical protein